ncbi:MAG: cation diffusion facilitator family transporter [Bacillota bacterium]|uniref:cation diffusion facilitator family transporter n=1 Tax=Desulforudis sp. DRI-14 TaxID=3459793 RepID=UPI003484D218
MAHNSESAIKAALVANGLIALMKLGGAVVSGSSAMAAEFKHSVADWSNSFFLLYGVKSAKRPLDQHYNFGYGKRVFFYSFLASLGMITIGGALSIYGGVMKILHPEPLEHVALNLAILGASIVFETYSLTMALKALCAESGARARGLGLFPAGIKALVKATPSTRFIFFEDSIALLGLIVAAVAIGLTHWTGIVTFDGIASIIIGLILFYVGMSLAKDNADIITGESLPPETTREIGDFIMSIPGVHDIHTIRSMAIGPNSYLFEVIIEGDGNLPLDKSDDLGFLVKRKVKERFPQIRHAQVTVIADDRRRQWPGVFEDSLTAASKQSPKPAGAQQVSG